MEEAEEEGAEAGEEERVAVTRKIDARVFTRKIESFHSPSWVRPAISLLVGLFRLEDVLKEPEDSHLQPGLLHELEAAEGHR
jgi:hypothetical protein